MVFGSSGSACLRPVRHRLAGVQRQADLGGVPVGQPAQRRRDVRIRRADAAVLAALGRLPSNGV